MMQQICPNCGSLIDQEIYNISIEYEGDESPPVKTIKEPKQLVYVKRKAGWSSLISVEKWPFNPIGAVLHGTILRRVDLPEDDWEKPIKDLVLKYGDHHGKETKETKIKSRPIDAPGTTT